jgi:predicted amidophosphoribosyltransferase
MSLTDTPTLTYPRTSLTWLGSCLEVILPTQCLVCTRPLRRERICYRCRPPLPDLRGIQLSRCARCFEPLPLSAQVGSVCEPCHTHPLLPDSIRFIWEYDGLARDLIRIMKYRPSTLLAGLCGSLLKDSIPSLFNHSSWDLIIPVPSSRITYRKRLFHPCVELAHAISRQVNAPLCHALTHDKHRLPQASLDHDARLRKLRHLFRVRHPGVIAGKRILLVEDVITTGATIAAAAYQLRQAGATHVDVIALARTRVWKRFRARVHTIFTPTKRMT